MNGDAKWSNGPTGNTTSVIDCSGNQTNPPFQQSSKAWCCSLTNSRGVFAYSQPDPHDPHQSLTHIVSTISSSALCLKQRNCLQHGTLRGVNEKGRLAPPFLLPIGEGGPKGRMRGGASALGELEARARLAVAVLLALDHAGIAGEEATLLQRGPEVRLEIGQALAAVAHAPPARRGRLRSPSP